MTGLRNARPDRIRIRLWEDRAPGAVPLALPHRRLWHVGLVFGLFFLVFAAIEWTSIARLSGRSVDDLFDLMFVLFEVFWVLGWSAGVLLVGGLAVLFLFYSESARLQDGKLVHVPRVGRWRS